MKAVLLAVGVLGLAIAFGMFEPASAKPVTSDDVRFVSERMSEQPGYHTSRTRHGNRGCRCRA
jgi:hypothetical protein